MTDLVRKYNCLSLSAQLQGVASTPVATARTTNQHGVPNTRSTKTTVLLAGTSQAAQFTLLLYSSANPVDLGIATDGFVEGINANNLNKRFRRVRITTKQKAYLVELES